jgi:WD40 repeat protein
MIIFSLVACVTGPSVAEYAPAATVTATSPPEVSKPALDEASVTVGGYTFSYPQEVPDGRESVDIVGRLPGSITEIVDTRSRQVVAIDVYTGKIREFSPQFEHDIAPGSVKLLANGQVLFYAYSTQTERKTDLWISGGEDRLATEPIFQEPGFTPIVLPDGKSLILYNAETLETVVVSSSPLSMQAQQTEQVITEILTKLSTTPTADERLPKFRLSYRTTASPGSRWTVFDKQGQLLLIDLETSEIKPITVDLHWRATTLRWSPDGQTLALLVTEGPRPIPYQKLFILDVNTMQPREIGTGFRYVTDITWAPDNQSVLLMVEDGQFEGYGTRKLLLVNVLSNTVEVVPVLPRNALGTFGWGLSWSPDGETIAIAYADEPGNYNLYRIDILDTAND